jgi:hypothetical protein
LFRFYIETACFGVSIQPKQSKKQPKQTEKARKNEYKNKEVKINIRKKPLLKKKKKKGHLFCQGWCKISLNFAGLFLK